MDLKKNIMRVFSANFLTMISGVIIGFIIPATLSIEAYSKVQTYMLYISYIGFLHLGFIDGMYVKYGGKKLEEINMHELKGEHHVFHVIQLIMTIIFLCLSIIQKDLIILLMALSIIPINTISFHKLFYQAIGQFKSYAKLSYIYTIIYLVFNITLALLCKSDKYVHYCIINLLANGIVSILVEIKFYKSMKAFKSKYSIYIFNNIKVGFFILLGNLSVMLFYSIDKWFVKIFFDDSTFAYYSFAISIVKIINLLITAISITFYNFLAQEKNEETIIKFKKYFLMLGTLVSSTYFVFSGIINMALPKYINSINIIAILFAGYPYIIIINTLYVNLYKINKDEKKYLAVVLKMLIISLVFNTIGILLFKSDKSIAFATTLSFIVWYLYSMKDFEFIKLNIKEIIYLSVCLISFLILSNYFNWIIGAILYLSILVGINIKMFKQDILLIVRTIIKKYK